MYNVTRYEVTGLDLLFPAITNDSSPHSNTGLELSHDVTGLPVMHNVRAAGVVK